MLRGSVISYLLGQNANPGRPGTLRKAPRGPNAQLSASWPLLQILAQSQKVKDVEVYLYRVDFKLHEFKKPNQR